MSHKVKSNGTIKELAEMKDVKALTSDEVYWEKDDSAGDIPVLKTVARKKGKLAVVNVSSKLTRALTAGQAYWLGSPPAEFTPATDVANVPVANGHVTIRLDGTKPSIKFTPSANMSTGAYVYIMIPYMTI
ncbi:hypothetical protein [Faecalibaculum rodentium]|uniref:hypothetical protein n=1 Tax=Faecalibaculum rodentium TaxID=1702221 RepID=UPI00273140E2|nr:hypothetical protein [Faecalibaculum rodentium]